MIRIYPVRKPCLLKRGWSCESEFEYLSERAGYKAPSFLTGFIFTYLFGCKKHNRRNNAQSPVIESYIPPRPGLHHKKPHVTG